MAFVKGSRILAKLTPLEVERGIFIAGHRFEPLRSPDRSPWELQLLLPDGRKPKARLVPLSLKNASIYFTFFGLSALPGMFIEQDEANAQALNSSGGNDAILRLRAFELGDLYASAGLVAGDYLEIDAADAEGTRFLVRPIKASGIAPELRQAWLADMGAGVEAALRKLGAPVSPEAFIQAAFEGAPPSVLAAPTAAFSEFYNESGALQIKDFGGASFMWSKGSDIPTLLMDGQGEDFDGDLDELSKALADHGFALDSTEVAAFVRDALWRGEPLEKGLERCFVGADELGFPKSELDALLDQARAFGRDVAKAWDASKENARSARLRSTLLDIYAPFLLWMRKMGGIVTSPKQLETQEFDILSEAMQNVCDLIHAVAEAGALKAKELDDAEKFAPTLARMTIEIMDTIEAGIPKAGRKKSVASKGRDKKRPAPEKWYLLEIRLADIKPIIRRQILVPGNRSLADLHAIFQDAFGWTDSHLHAFRIRGEAYGLPSPEVYEPLIDERRVRLDDLSLRGRSRFEYVYDFGDDWEHEILVIMSKKDLAGPDTPPFCLEAERAHPPEDCGGAPGYTALLEALAKPAGKRNADEAGLLKWIGDDWDPRRCDIHAINEALAKR